MKIARFFLSVSTSETTFTKRGFYSFNEKAKDHLQRVGCEFLHGYHEALDDNSLTELTNKLNLTELNYRGFVFEGAAMALALLDFLSPFNRSRLSNFIQGVGNNHIYMLHVGAGWAYAKLPVNVEKQIAKLDPILKWLAMDGYGFCKAYFETKKYVINKQLPRGLSRTAMHVFYQGVGRCLWFIEGADPERIAAAVQGFPKEFHSDFWAGIGLASAYAGGVTESTLENLRVLGNEHIQYLAQGAAFAARARVRAGNLTDHTDMACMIYCGLSADEAGEITDAMLADVRKSTNLEIEPYQLWRNQIANLLIEQK